MGSGTGDTARARLRIDDTGTITIWAGPNHTGQSIHTTYEQVAADTLDLPIEQIDVHVGDTGAVPESGPTAASAPPTLAGTPSSRPARSCSPGASGSACRWLRTPPE